MPHQNYIGFIGLGGLSPEIQFNTRVIYTLNKLALSFFKTITKKFHRGDSAEILHEDWVGGCAFGKNIEMLRARIARAQHAENAFLGVLKKTLFRE